MPIVEKALVGGEGAGILEKGEIKAKVFHLLKNWKAELIARLY